MQQSTQAPVHPYVGNGSSAAEVKSDGAPGDSAYVRLALNAGRPLKVAILSDFTRITYANGAVFQTRTLYRELRRAGHHVVIIGPHDPDAAPSELGPDVIEVPSRPMRAYPGVHVPLPLDRAMFDPTRWDFDVVFGQTTSLLIEFGLWLREMKGIPLLCVNTTHLPAAYEVLLPSWMAQFESLRAGIVACLKHPFERLFRDIYNESDGLVVLSEGLADYWRSNGVRVPIHVIPRAVSRDVFLPAAANDDPYLRWLRQLGLPSSTQRLICAGRHTPEKEQDRIIRIFASHILPSASDSVLFLVGVGPNTPVYRELAKSLGVAHRVVFTGEVPFQQMPGYYKHADVFLHASRSETFGNVLGEALWSGSAVVAFADGMGVSSQIENHRNGCLIESKGRSAEKSDEEFGKAAISLLRDVLARKRLGREAARLARQRSAPEVIDELTAAAFESAIEHVRRTVPVPAIRRSRLEQWLSTARHVQRWALIMGGVYLGGQLRSPSTVRGAQLVHPGLSVG